MNKLTMQDLKTGHLIFQSTHVQTDWENAVVQSHHSQNISHVGIVVDNERVIEATLNTGVTATPIEAFLKKAKQNWVYAFNHPQFIHGICDYVEKQLGQPYNDSFLNEAPGFYCSELIVKAAYYASPDYFYPSELNFYLPNSQTIAPYWVDYYNARNMAVPQGKIGSHPAGLILQKQAITYIREIII